MYEYTTVTTPSSEVRHNSIEWGKHLINTHTHKTFQQLSLFTSSYMFLYCWKRYVKIKKGIISFVSASFAPFFPFFHPFRTLYASLYSLLNACFMFSFILQKTISNAALPPWQVHENYRFAWKNHEHVARCTHGVTCSLPLHMYVYTYTHEYTNERQLFC
jgi:hypothetical protein